MVWCSSCSLHCRGDRRDEFIICNRCGKVLEHDNFSNEPTFTKGVGGQSTISGNFVRTIQNTLSISRERIMNRARMDMDFMVTALGLSGGDSLVSQALALYTIAADRSFTKGRRVEQVEAACLYIACRENKKPFLLIDFSEYLRVNVYVLGAVFLQLCKLLSLEEHPIVQKPVDPSLFIHRFTGCLMGSSNPEVSKTAIHILASMKRDWMQTGRKPSGLCGAALYISALSHGVKCTKADVIRVVHVCESTLMKRLIEFEETESGALTLEEFNLKADELDKLLQGGGSFGPRASAISELLCEHKGSERVPYCHGLCQSCYDDFITLSGGIDGGLDPPAFQRAEREREIAATDEWNSNEIVYSNGDQFDIGKVIVEKKTVAAMPDVSETFSNKVFEEKTFDFDVDNEVSGGDESCGFSDIDDVEVDGYLHNEEEKRLKKIIWEELNKEYLEEQAVKEAAAAAARKEFEANFEGRPEDLKAAQELAAAAAVAVSKSRKERQRKRAEEVTNMGPPRTAAEATRQMLTKKRLSSKINYDVLDKLFDEPVDSEPKRNKAESHSENEANENDVDIDNGWGAPEKERDEPYDGGEYVGYNVNPVDEYEYYADDYTLY